jgi:hypothetical protein
VRAALALALAALAACNSILGIEDFRLADAGEPDGPVVPPNTVIGTSMVTQQLADGTTATEPEDLSAYVISAYLPDAGEASGFSVVDGVGRADGTFEIAPVPEGVTYYLMLRHPERPGGIEYPQFFVTDARVVDLGYSLTGRLDAVDASEGTRVAFTVGDMQPWDDESDSLMATSFNTGSEAYFFAPLANAPATGATALAGATYDWYADGFWFGLSGGRPRLVDAARGDDLWLAHLRREPGVSSPPVGFFVTRLLDIFRASAVAMRAGEETVISGSFDAVAADRQETATVFVGDLIAGWNDGGAAVLHQVNAARYVAPAASRDTGSPGAPLWELVVVPRPGAPSSFNTTMMYGNPYPAGWEQLVTTTYIRARRVAAPGATNGTFLASVSFADRAPAATAQISSLLRPPASVAIEGEEALLDGGRIGFDGTTPVEVTWTAVSGAHAYVVHIQRLFRSGTGTARTSVASLTTTDTSIRVPAALLVEGELYAVRVGAVSGRPDPVAAPRRTAVPSGGAFIFTAPFLFSRLCGNGALDPGEECDPGPDGDTPTCDRDCSVPRCGDGIRNAAAGEACDHGGRYSLTCNADCTPSVCGDGKLNPMTEVCDDGASGMCRDDCSGFAD